MGIVRKLDALEAELPDTRVWFERNFANAFAQFGLFLAVAFVARFATFGDPSIHVDESWYFYVGQKMHEGALPYVDIWDRKPFLLFGLFYLFAGISDSVLSYQIAALLFASTTALVIARIALLWTGQQGAVLAGIAYIGLLNALGGVGGQAPVFYNLLIALEAYLVLSSLEELKSGRVPGRIYLGMICGGLAIMMKQTSLFEAAFFGLLTVYLIWKSGRPLPLLKIGVMIMLGALPTLVIAAFYYWAGHWAEFWHAMVQSNLNKRAPEWLESAGGAVMLVLKLWLIVPVAGLAISRHARSNAPKVLLGLWLITALVGFLSVPYFAVHYALPLAVSLTVIAASVFDRSFLGFSLSIFIFVSGLIADSNWNLAQHRENTRNIEWMAKTITLHSPRNTMFLFDGPIALYDLSGTQEMTSLQFPNHFNETRELNASHLDTMEELRRVLRNRPGSIVVSTGPRSYSYNLEAMRLVHIHAAVNCANFGAREIYEITTKRSVRIFGDCR